MRGSRLAPEPFVWKTAGGSPTTSVSVQRKGAEDQLVLTASVGLARPGLGPEHSATDSLSLFTPKLVCARGLYSPLNWEYRNHRASSLGAKAVGLLCAAPPGMARCE